MKFNPIKKALYTDSDKLIKKLHCPYKKQWDNLSENDEKSKKCLTCNEVVVDTQFFSEKELVEMVKENPDVCVKVDLLQDNIRVVTI